MNESLDHSERAQFEPEFMVWTNNNRMKCNTAKCKELQSATKLLRHCTQIG